MNNPYSNYHLYIAGPECFYPRGYSLWHAQRKLAEYYGFTVVLPNNTPLKLDHEDLRMNAQAIFANLREVIKETNIIIADLELFRSSEPDCGTLYEMGMVYASGGLVYGYTRDKRVMAAKNQYALLQDGQIRAQKDELHSYADIPFAPSVIAGAKIVEGTFEDCLKLAVTDLEERRKIGITAPAVIEHKRSMRKPKKIFLSGPQRYAEDSEEQFSQMKKICSLLGFEGVSPLDGMEEVQSIEDPYTRSYRMFIHWQKLLHECDIFLGDLNDYHGLEPLNDTAFEAGVAWILNKRCYGYMGSAKKMRLRIPNNDGFDVAGNVVENFDYPINLMFSASMPIIEGDFKSVIEKVSLIEKTHAYKECNV